MNSGLRVEKLGVKMLHFGMFLCDKGESCDIVAQANMINRKLFEIFISRGSDMDS